MEMSMKMEEVRATIRREYGEWKNKQEIGYMYGGDAKFWKGMVEKMDEAIRVTEEENEELRSKKIKTREEYEEIVAERDRLEPFVNQSEELGKDVVNSW